MSVTETSRLPKRRGVLIGRAKRRGINITELIETGDAPLQVMIDNMLFHHKNAQYLGERLSEMLEAPQGSVDVKECFKVAGQLVSARENSQKCASEAAPYCHPKLAAIAVQHSDAPERTEVDIDNASPEQLENAWAQELLG